MRFGPRIHQVDRELLHTKSIDPIGKAIGARSDALTYRRLKVGIWNPAAGEARRPPPRSMSAGEDGVLLAIFQFNKAEFLLLLAPYQYVSLEIAEELVIKADLGRNSDVKRERAQVRGNMLLLLKKGWMSPISERSALDFRSTSNA